MFHGAAPQLHADVRLADAARSHFLDLFGYPGTGHPVLCGRRRRDLRLHAHAAGGRRSRDRPDAKLPGRGNAAAGDLRSDRGTARGVG